MTTIWTKYGFGRCIGTAILTIALVSAFAYFSGLEVFAAEESLLAGRVTSTGGGAVAGVPIRAHRENSNITVSVYTNGHGDYSYPGWSDLSPGSYSVTIELPDFALAKQESVTVSAGKTARVDFTLQPRQPSVDDATVGEVAMAMPGTEEQKHMFSECGQCHSLQFALQKPHSRDAWLQIINFMAGKSLASQDFPGTRDFRQKRYIEQLADYLATVRGPGSSSEVPFKFRSRPTSEASTRLVVTEYDVPGGGKRELTMTRGDRRFKWPHDVAVDAKGQYVWYTDNFKTILGRLDTHTGEIKEFPFTFLPGMDYDPAKDPRRLEEAFTETGGANKIALLPDGELVIGGFGGRTVIFDPKTEKFKLWPSGSVFFGIDPAGKVWYGGRANLEKLDPNTGEVVKFAPPPHGLGYDVDEDHQGRFVYNVWRGGAVGVFDPKTEKYSEYPTPSPGSGPRRGTVDAKNRWWTGLYWAGTIARFDPDKGEVKEFSLIPGLKAYQAPYLAPYVVAVDDKNQLAWASDFNSGRMYAFNMKTEKPTEFFMPGRYEVRHLAVDKSTARPTVWIPAYRPPSKIVKVQIR